MTLLVKGVQVLGASKPLPKQVDIFVSGGKISAIGNFPHKGADEVIDGQGAYVSQGFIEVSAESDHDLSLFQEPDQQKYLAQGVTTIVCGQGGSSLAPLLYGTLESIRKWVDPRLNVNWSTVKEFLSTLEKKPLGVNFATLVGHSTIRRALIGDELRDLTKNELAVFGGVLERALREGGFGLSVGLATAHTKGTSYPELKTLAKIVKNYDGLYATSLRKPATLLDSMNETVRVAQETGVKTIVSNFLPHEKEGKEYKQAVAILDALPKETPFYFNISLLEADVVPLYQFLPEWAQKGSLEEMNGRLRDEWLTPRIVKDLTAIRPEHFKITRAVRHEALSGRTLQDFMALYSLKNTKAALLKLMLITDLKCVIEYKNTDSKLLRTALQHPRSIPTSDFTKYLSWVANGLLPLEEAIKKITTLPAQLLNIPGRTGVKEGNAADLVGFKNEEIKFVVVNGRLAFKDGALSDLRAGEILRHKK